MANEYHRNKEMYIVLILKEKITLLVIAHGYEVLFSDRKY